MARDAALDAPGPIVDAGTTPSPDARYADWSAIELERLGVGLVVPPRAVWGYEHDDAVKVVYSGDVIVRIRVVEGVSAQLQAQARDGSHARDSRVLDEGITDDGVSYVAVTFEVRKGMPSNGSGRHVHYWDWVTRVYGFLPLADDRSATCQVYLEYGADSADRPGIHSALHLCTSMRPLP